jgi:hypothetical protein
LPPGVDPRPPYRASPPAPALLSEHSALARRFRLLESKRERLARAAELLDRRIDSATRLLAQQRHEAALRAVRSLSPTAAGLLHSPAAPPPPEPLIELSLFQTQLDAIRALKSGAIPKPPGEISIDFPAELQRHQARLREQADETRRLIARVSEALARCFGDDNGIGVHEVARDRLAATFAKFTSAYHSAAYAADTLPHRRLIADLRARAAAERAQAAEDIRSDLEIERQFLMRELADRGAGDEDAALMRHEIEVELVYLRHLTAIAGTALAKMSAHPAPIDPVEVMQLDIAESEVS